MREFEKKKKFKNILKSKWTLVPLSVLFILLANSTWGVYQKNRSLMADLEVSQAKLAKANNRKSELASANQSLETESGIEREIRDRLQMAKEGEREIVIVEDPVDQNQFVANKKTFLQKVVDFFTIR